MTARSTGTHVTRARTQQQHRTQRQLSQNFLADRAVARRFARLAVPEPAPGARLLEVGAGRGALTVPLARRAATLVAYELDARLVPGLRRRLDAAGLAQVRVHQGDFLAAAPPRAPFAVAGNVPFSRTSAVVEWCLRAPALTDATFLTQLEYARKRTGDYGSWTRLTVLTWPLFSWRLLGRVPRTAFRPVPRVDAGVLRIERRPVPLLAPAHHATYQSLVALGFSGVGGSVRASLRRAHPRRRVDAALRTAGVAPTALAGEPTPQQWLTIHAVLEGKGPTAPE
ncbi:ErmE/ErmH/ErmO/ErmR family 23S rRNA (adenine(2058)-N(6))-methyltransferase [Streptomyces sp. VRA16 Mangrove soil]|uniref:ErmE/ErmH/ErmO/ErmR family 23S rRNA (adenine(2058)-N(6))-methyltransferase n=1 Tax=Streptomyces sp. VRA16 Mangrove soil TaxID=2817434 RepID=UPI001A9CD58D|nr:ErmE/ErmH/ErmO/ErmR family 23S rRNA (adenine(2058)-N(6))-methyltransferase [Streptomyces sp. VRA16 Mangrove soil]MBO1335492.1 ErmE/ErmH/ErmO/ErmR family 23S rRNA (adenine(2058)-N(6))-methyltransferase [Streptomyces sp. VRA16 Mangrove soil]